MISGILNKVGWKLIKSSFFVRIKTFEVLAYIWSAFLQNCKWFQNHTTDFSLTSANSFIFALYFIFVLYQFEVNCDHTTRCTKCWSNETLKCYAKKFVIVDRQTEEDWVLSHYLLSERVFLPKSLLQKKKKELNSQKPMVNTVSTTRRTTLCWMRGEIEELLFIEITICPFRKKKISKKQV